MEEKDNVQMYTFFCKNILDAYLHISSLIYFHTIVDVVVL